MKQLLLILAITFICFVQAFSSTYYFSSSSGNDSHTSTQAQDPNTPWKSIKKLNESMDLIIPGDSILFKRGDVFFGKILLTRSGSAQERIIISAYGSGQAPVITGVLTINNWSNIGNNLWVADCPQLDNIVMNFYIDEISQQLGRYPNITDKNKGYLNIDSQIKDSILICSTLVDGPVFKDAEAVIRTSRFTFEKFMIAEHHQESMILDKRTFFPLREDFGFFIQSHINTLDTEGEWYYSPNERKMFLFLSQDPNSLTTEASALDFLFQALDKQFFTIADLEFNDSFDRAIHISNSNNIEIRNCLIRNSGNNGLNITNSDVVTISRNEFSDTNNNAIVIEKSKAVIFQDNRILRVGLRPGMGTYAYGNRIKLLQNTGIYIEANGSACEANYLDSIGYCGIYFKGDSVLIKNNYILNVCMTLEDGGGIYSYNENKIIHTNRRIEHNIVLNSIGAKEGIPSQFKSIAYGIFMDYGVDHVSIIGNTVAYCKGSGIFNHHTNHLSLFNNTLFSNSIQLEFGNVNSKDFTHTGHIVSNNIFYATSTEQLLTGFTASSLVEISEFGNFDHNYYCRPNQEHHSIRIIYPIDDDFKQELLGLTDWQNRFNLDTHSSTTPYNLPIYSTTIKETNRIKNGSFEEDISHWGCFSPYGNCVAEWDNNNVIEDGSLRLRFSEPFNNADGKMLVGQYIGNIVSNANYLFKCSMSSTGDEKEIRLLFRDDSPERLSISTDIYFNVNQSVSDHQFLIIPNTTVNNASVDISIKEDKDLYWIDNVEFFEVDISISKSVDSLILVYNSSFNDLNIRDQKYYIDARGFRYHNFSLSPFSSLILLEHEEMYYKPIDTIRDAFLLIYPNPTKDIVNVITNSDGVKMLSVITIDGKTIKTIETDKQSIIIDVSEYEQGYYIIKIRSEEGISSAKLLVI